MTEIRSEFGEPWERKISENGPDGRLLAYVSSDRFRILMDKIGDPPDVYMLTDRIVACVNFLAGVPTETLVALAGDAYHPILKDMIIEEHQKKIRVERLAKARRDEQKWHDAKTGERFP